MKLASRRAMGWTSVRSAARPANYANRAAVSAFVSRAAINAVIAPTEIGEDLVADGAHAGGEVVDAHAIADQGGEVAAPRGALGQVADVYGEEVHGDAAGDRATPAGHDHLGRGPAPGGGRRPEEAVGIA